MSVEAPVAPAAPAAPKPAAPSAPAASAPAAPSGGAQGVKPAPAGTIPPKLQSFSDRPESTKNKVFERLRAGQTGRKTGDPAPATPQKAAEPAEPKDDDIPQEPPTEPDPQDLESDELLGTPKSKKDAPAPAKKDGAPVDGKKPKVNPWKLIDEHKGTISTKDKEIAELRKMITTPEARKSEVAELESLRAQNKELLDKIRYVEYQSHPEFTEKYDKPYKASWSAAMKALKGVTAASEDGMGGREITPQDLLDLVNLPPARARQLAMERFGDYANDVMLERDKIHTAYSAREGALESARTEGSKKMEADQKARFEASVARSTKLKSEFDQANERFSKRKDMAEFFQDIDGDDDANSMLKKGYELFDTAFEKNVTDDDLTDEQRSVIVKKHAAIRHRSAAFGRVRYLLAAERAAHEVTKAKLAEFQSTVPNRGGSAPSAPQTAAGGKAMDRMLARLRAKAA